MLDTFQQGARGNIFRAQVPLRSCFSSNPGKDKQPRTVRPYHHVLTPVAHSVVVQATARARQHRETSPGAVYSSCFLPLNCRRNLVGTGRGRGEHAGPACRMIRTLELETNADKGSTIPSARLQSDGEWMAGLCECGQLFGHYFPLTRLQAQQLGMHCTDLCRSLSSGNANLFHHPWSRLFDTTLPLSQARILEELTQFPPTLPIVAKEVPPAIARVRRVYSTARTPSS